MGQNRDIDTKLRYFTVNFNPCVRFFHCVRGVGTPKLTVKTNEFVLILKCVPACKIRTAAKAARLSARLPATRGDSGAAARPLYPRFFRIQGDVLPCIFAVCGPFCLVNGQSR